MTEHAEMASREARSVADALPALQAKNLPRLEWTALFTVKTDGAALPAADAEILREYFQHFLPPDKDCVCCASQQGSSRDDEIIDVLLGRAKFRWGLAHGEGACSVCGYPARAIHYDVGPIKRLDLILQYHPDELQARPDQARSVAESDEAPTP